LSAWLEASARDVLRVAVRSAGFDRVALDVRGFRSGSLNVLGGVVAEPLVRARSSVDSGDPAGLTRELQRLGFAFEVEGRQRLAVLTAAMQVEGDRLVDPRTRTAVLEVARGYGFTHVALDLGLTVVDAAIHRG